MEKKMNIDIKYTLSLMEELMNIPSPAGDTTEAMYRLIKEFENLGIEVHRTNKGAIYGTILGEDFQEVRLVNAHIDTLGAMVKEIKPNGRLRLTNIGGYSWGSVEGETVYIKTADKKIYTGTILPDKASVHIFSDDARTSPRDEDTMEVRIDEDVKNPEETRALGIEVGDFVCVEPRFTALENGYIKSRHLDDKACVAIMFAAIKYLVDNNLKLKYTTHFFVSDYEEIGHGVYGFPSDITEIMSLDIGTVGGNHNSSERAVTIVSKDRITPYDLEIKNKLIALAKENNIDYRIDVHYRYASDASVMMTQGVDARISLIGLGVDATHHYERTHVDGIENNIKLLLAYLIAE